MVGLFSNISFEDSLDLFHQLVYVQAMVIWPGLCVLFQQKSEAFSSKFGWSGWEGAGRNFEEFT